MDGPLGEPRAGAGRARVGLISPGEMGATVGAAAAGAREVLWASEGRGRRTRARAEAAGLADAGDLAQLVDRCDVVLSVCPPGRAVDVARAVSALGFDGVYLDANAVAPGTSEDIGEVVGGKAAYVDGSLIGPPVREAGTTRLYLAGERAETVAAVFAGGPLEVVTLGSRPGAASALKMCFAAYTKGSAALLLNVWALAASEGVDGALLREWQGSRPQLVEQAEERARKNAPKAWRFVDEMAEVAGTFDRAGLPDGFHRAAAEVYARMGAYKDADEPVTLSEVVEALLRRA